jgi:uncharacterized membrane protein YkoI
MTYRKLVPVALAAVITLGAAGGVVAETGKDSSKPAVTSTRAAETSLADAVMAAERQTGGRALKVKREHERSAWVYEVKVLTKGSIAKVQVGIGVGKVIRTKKEGFVTRILERGETAELAKYTAMPTTLSAAIKTAAQHVGGKAIKAEVEDEDGKMLIEVKVEKDRSVQKVKIDAATGKIVNSDNGKNGERDDD